MNSELDIDNPEHRDFILAAIREAKEGKNVERVTVDYTGIRRYEHGSQGPEFTLKIEYHHGSGEEEIPPLP